MLEPRGIAWAGLYAADLSRLIAFYAEQVGLRLLERGERHGLLDAGGGALFELWDGGAATTGCKSAREQSVVVGFEVDALEPVVARLRAAGVEADGPIGSHLGTRWVYYTDPEGNRFEFKDRRG